MKAILMGALAALVLVGAGCLGSKEVEGKWRLAFDLPEGWIMAEAYRADLDEVVTVSTEVTRDASDVVLQSTALPVYAGGVKPQDSVDARTYITEDFTLIQVYRLDESRVIPSKAEDLGEGWYRLKLCEIGEDCTLYGQYNYDYYYRSPLAGKYKFSIATDGQDVERAIAVIRSAQAVTVFTDQATTNE